MRKLIITCAVLVANLFAANAQDKPAKIELNLQEALQIAMSDNPTIKVANMEIERQEYIRKETLGSLMPQISASGSYNYNIMNPVMFMPEGVFGPGTGGPMSMGFSNSFAGGFSLALPVYMPTLYKTLQLNEKQMMQAVESARQSKITLANQVKKSYFAIMLAQSSLSVINRNIEYAKIVVDNARSSFKQGVSSEYDLITAEVQLSNLQPVLLAAKNGMRISRLMFNMLLSFPLETEVTVREKTEHMVSFIATDTTNSFSLDDNSDLRLLDIQGEMLETQLEMQKAAKLPTLNAIAQYQVQSQNNSLNLGTYEWRGTALAGLQLSVPIFSGFSKTNKERQIKNSIGQLNIQRQYMEENLNVEAQTAISNLTTARANMIANTETKLKAEKGYRISKTRFETGTGTIVELNGAQMSFLEAELTYTQSVHDYMVAKADLDKVIGTIN